MMQQLFGSEHRPEKVISHGESNYQETPNEFINILYFLYPHISEPDNVTMS